MKKTLTLLLLTLLYFPAFSQEKPAPPKLRSAGTSEILKTDKWVENFKIKKEKFNVYLGYQKLNDILRQENGDTLEVYKITFDKRKSSEKEITKYATRKGKIICEGSYKVSGDTLTIIYNSFDYIGAYKSTAQYTIDKYGFFKEIGVKTESIDTDKLSDKYLKPAELKVPEPPKN